MSFNIGGSDSVDRSNRAFNSPNSSSAGVDGAFDNIFLEAVSAVSSVDEIEGLQEKLEDSEQWIRQLSDKIDHYLKILSV